MQHTFSLTPQTSRTLSWMFLAFWALMFAAIFFRNLPTSVLYQDLVQSLDQEVLTPLGFYHRGWGMFPGPTSQTIIVQLRYTYADGSEEIKEYFPLRSSMKRSAWNEVMEDIAIRDDNNDFRGSYQKGFFAYECRTVTNESQVALARIAIEQAVINQQELYANGGYPQRPPQFFTKTQHTCL